MSVFWDVAPHTVLEIGGPQCLHHQGAMQKSLLLHLSQPSEPVKCSV